MSESVEQAAQALQLGDMVAPVAHSLYPQHRCVVVAIQRRRFRAEIEYPDGHRRWYPIRELRHV